MTGTLPDLSTTLKIYMSLLITSYEVKRNFSKLSIIKKQTLINYVEEWLNYVSILSIETVITAVWGGGYAFNNVWEMKQWRDLSDN